HGDGRARRSGRRRADGHRGVRQDLRRRRPVGRPFDVGGGRGREGRDRRGRRAHRAGEAARRPARRNFEEHDMNPPSVPVPGPFLVAVIVVGIFFFMKWVNILNEYERAVTFWLGRLSSTPKGPGLTLIFWPFERMVRVSLRTIVMDVPPQDVIT